MAARQKEVGIVVALCIVVVVSFFLDTAAAAVMSLLPLWLQNAAAAVSSWSIVVVAAIVLYAGKAKPKKIITTLIATAAVVSVLKFLVARPRPAAEVLLPLLNIPDYSFPSMRAALVFALVPLLQEKRVRLLWITAAVIVATSRIITGVHFLSDVVAGAALGYGVGWAVSRWT